MKKDREIFWYRHQKGDGGGGWRVPPLSSLIKVLYILLDPLPQHTFEDDRISQKVLKKEKHVLEQATLLYWLPQSDVGKKSLSFSPWEPQTPFFFLRAPDPFLLLWDPGLLSNLPRNWLSQLWWIFHNVYVNQVNMFNIYIYILFVNYTLMPEGRLILKKPLMYSNFFFMSQTYKNGKVLIILYWWAWWEFITLFSWYFMHVWNFLLQKRMIRAENFNFSITYLSCVSFLSDNAIHNVWYQTCPDLQSSFTFPTFSSVVNTQQLVLLQK